MHKLIKLLLVIVIFTLGCMGANVSSREMVKKSSTLITHMGQSTVALVLTGSDGLVRVYCTGVWVGRNEILTAHHCVQAAANLDSEDDEDLDAMGIKIHFTLQQENMGVGESPSVIHLSTVVAVDPTHDLALVKAEGEAIPAHPIAKLVDISPAIGERVYIVGHVKGLYWSFISGTVAAYRSSLPYAKNGGPFMQLSAPVYYGNSGGGVFNADGELCGIVSFMASAPMTNFAIDIYSLDKFLKRARESKKL